jgi:hypothetical protein
MVIAQERRGEMVGLTEKDAGGNGRKETRNVISRLSCGRRLLSRRKMDLESLR